MIILIPVLTFGFIGKPTEMSIALIAGFICSILLNINKFESFKAGQISAKLRETEEVIKEANATIDQLKKISEPVMSYLLAQIIEGNRFSGVSGKYKEDLLLKMEDNYKEFELMNKQNSQLIEKAKVLTLRTYFEEIELEVEEHVGWDECKPIREFLDQYKEDYPNIEIYKEILIKHGFLFESVKEKIKDYERYKESTF